ncbi:chymotrypsin-1-like isoform X2 [Galleria mellonella]|uniref:Chymotrypsin-1-like isoform X2 n=1 Tax=Galleria mellonella TaxID=7137 RepID=A0ABM3MEY8_GALME|nr:chymotrypsin-1-like isoform X2 [Galleria mellonella]
MYNRIYNTLIVVGFVLVQYKVLSTIHRVVGGYDAPIEFGKFHASLQNLTGHHVCGSAVVSKSHVVTAAHCVLGAEPQYVKVVVGTNNLDKGGLQYNAEAININEGYDGTSRVNDIAIVKITGSFDLQHVTILDLDNNELSEGDPVILTGFGAQEPNGESSRQMYALNLTVFCQETCRYAMRYSKEVVDSMFCTFTQIGQGTCHGDSGGPLIKDNKLVGLVSWGIPCAVGFPDVHTRISHYTEWIKEETKHYLPTQLSRFNL